jgi:predicted house-cleaning noncanonical NTP pyrophosphatase (MazG superfamily)
MEAMMNSNGKLVRDLIPDLIRDSGRNPEVRYLSGQEMVDALAAKLVEEASEAAKAVNSREHLVEELADLREVVTALMAAKEITNAEVAQAATDKMTLRGAFTKGAWLTD